MQFIPKISQGAFAFDTRIFDTVTDNIPRSKLGCLLLLCLSFGIACLLATEYWLLYLPNTLPWTGKKPGLLPRISACIRARKDIVPSFKAGYAKFGSKGKFYVRPDPLFIPEVMVPREYVRWLLEQPQDVLSVLAARNERHALDYVFPKHDEAFHQLWVGTIHKKMTRNLLKLQGVLIKEISRNIDEALGIDTENWVEANVWATVEKAVFSPVIRIMIGESVCRDVAFKRDVSRWTRAFGFLSMVVGRLMPRILKPLLGTPLSFLPRLSQRILLNKWFIPLIEERFDNLSRKRQNPDFDYNPPQDLITWASDAILRTEKSKQCGPTAMAHGLAVLIPAAMPSITATVTNAIFDVLSCGPDMNVQEHLYREIVNALDTSPDKGWGDQSLLSRLVLLHSTLRETMRVNPVALVVGQRKVVSRAGVTLPSGQHIPKGTWLGVSTTGVHTEYPNADMYDPFRFCAHRPDEKIERKDSYAPPNTSQGIVNVTDNFLTFGLGKVACPGRWLASHVMHLTIAYLLYHYEIKPMAQRPLNTVMLEYNFPNRQATMIVRRRKH
ncbi:hypothetical protein AJ79_03335 [Helicocarpus griseus UAMH5409]|uniref:Cytochrome P450 n=1 Tax=Helicocarpus griseus UAMH5409 TaxID=1447875 RepID=A0A2B7XY12_9EURO|nr:hypothetical protein AJ79_03335 [Helicocarpus griseus UAMH5409]